nr:alkene reductase [Corynebacterium sp. TAE3-ERU12]
MFDSVEWSGLTLPNRIVMAPMTRVRSQNQCADELTAEYYAQRASAGLIISEGTFISPSAKGSAAVPGIWRQSQVDGWSVVTRAVHRAGGRIVAQLWHVGRVSHPALQPGGAAPVSPTSRAAEGGKCYIFDDSGEGKFVASTQPRGLHTEEIPGIIDDFATAASNAIAAGFDGVEIHGANGYLIHQFLNPDVNDRTDEWAAQDEDGCVKFPLAVADAVIAAVTKAGFGPGRVGMRLSPYGSINGMPVYYGIEATYLRLAAELGQRRVGYIHLADQSTTSRDALMPIPRDFIAQFRKEYPGKVIFTGGMTGPSAQQMLDDGLADLIGFGRGFIANPDLPHRIAQDLPWADYDQATVYAQGPQGYTDYPAAGE